ncbi:MAG: hypothetical protein K6F92_04510 [Lachnospiraceae bacterium]|nr:hypothetical protein [Lachnospiraceae bacterium]
MRRGRSVLSGELAYYGKECYYSTRFRVKFKEEPDRDVLQRAVDAAVAVCPWVLYRVEEECGKFYFNDDLSGTIQVMDWDCEHPVALGSEAVGDHVVGVFCSGRTVYFAFFHGLTDGRGILKFIEEVIKHYHSMVSGGDYTSTVIPATEYDAEPFDYVNDAYNRLSDAERAEAEQWIKYITDFVTPEPVWELLQLEATRHHLISMNKDDVAAFKRDVNARHYLSVFIALYFEAYRRVHGNVSGNLQICVPVDFRHVLGVDNAHRVASQRPMFVVVSVNPRMSIRDVVCVVDRFISGMTTDGAKLAYLQSFQDFYRDINSLKYNIANKILGTNADPRPEDMYYTFQCSYAKWYTAEDEYWSVVNSVYCLSPSFSSPAVLEVMGMPQQFCIAINQAGDNESYVNAYLQVLEDNGIRYSTEEEPVGPEQYITLRENWGVR